MAITAPAPPTAGTSVGEAPQDKWNGWKTIVFFSLGMLAIFVVARIYQQAFAWSKGTDFLSPDFSTYWLPLLYAELIIVPVATVAWWAWIVISGRAIASQPVSLMEEARRTKVLWGIVGATCVTLFFMASFFAEEDAVWHQVVVRDSPFTPSHIVLFYLAFPLGITLAVGGYLYGRTRLKALYGPHRGFPLSWFFLIGATVTEMGQVALNEWGHNLWLKEEFFSTPFHWPFVFYAWMAGAIFAIWFETYGRLSRLASGEEQQGDALKTEESAAPVPAAPVAASAGSYNYSASYSSPSS